MTSPDAAVGSSCPYCHFPIKPGVAVSSCDACHASHHVECWTENGGCAVTGCPQQAGAAEAPTAVQQRPSAPAFAESTGPTAAPAWGPPPSGQPPPPSRGSSGPRWAVVGGLVALVLVLAVAAGYFALAPGDDDQDDATPTARSADGAPTSGSGGTGADAARPDDAPGAQGDPVAAEKQRVAEELVSIMSASKAGRRENLAQNYGEALRLRTSVLRRLQGLQGADAAQQSAIRSFEYAISESRKSVIERRDSGLEAPPRNSHDQKATPNKERFCAKWVSSGMAELTGEACSPDAI